MSKRVPTVEWQVATDDTEWQTLCALPLAEPPLNAQPSAHGRLVAKWFLWGAAGLLLTLASAGGWEWRTTQGRVHQAEVEMTATAQQALDNILPVGAPAVASLLGDPAAADSLRQVVQEHSVVRAALENNPPAAYLDVAVYTVEFHGEQAIARIVTPAKNGEPEYRQTRFYRRTDADWQRIEPDAALWGPERSLETSSFVYHFRQNDAQAVIALAPQLDTLYVKLRHNVGLPTIVGGAKPIIEVSVTHPPGQAATGFGAPARIIVPSPAVYLAPVELTDAQLLAQSIALALFEQVLAQTSEQDQIGVTWQPLLNGLRLWQVWDLDLPLAAWREDVVKWIYKDVPATKAGEAIPLPAHYTALCAAHKLWMPSPREINIPLLCARPEWEEPYLQGTRDPILHLAQIVLSTPWPYPSMEINRQGQTVALATLIEYAVTTYGRERLPMLVAGLGQFANWETLLPAVYGVSAPEFEAGWQVYLAARYGVPSLSSRVNANH